MEFKDEIISKLKFKNIVDIVRLIIEYLCGERYFCGQGHYLKVCESEAFEKDKELLEILLKRLKIEGLNYEQFNELLLLLNQDIVSLEFFKFFFGKDDSNLHDLKISLKNLKEGVEKFRGFAMLCFGNFRYAHKQLIKKDSQEMKKKVIEPYKEQPNKIAGSFKDRPPQIFDTKHIKKNETQHIGYLSTEKFNKEIKTITSAWEKKKSALKLTQEELVKVSETYLQIDKIIKRAQKQALENTNIYLTWDYMDVYIATSMREKWEYEETFDFIREVFGNKDLKELRLRYFDPTQSLCKDRMNKGLVEGLMLKRAKCCIYMAQESDTMGKDSELAATLAQGKHVIAYIPKIDIDKYSDKIRGYPIEYFEKRLLILQAEGVFDDKEFSKKMKSYSESIENIDLFLQSLKEYHKTPTLTFWDKKEKVFKKKCVCFHSICKIVAIAENINFEKRARILKEIHPLAIQVDLETGVANGVLVVRSAGDCAKLLYEIITKDMQFTIKHTKNGKEEGITILEEKISGCPFRIVTDDEKLTNSFWNFYLTSDKNMF